MYRKGSAGLITFMNKEEYQSLPVNNFQGGSDPRAPQICGKFYAENLFEHRGMDGCFPGCNLQCTKGGWVTLVSGDHVGEKVWVDGPEYETAAGFGSNLGIWNAEFIMEANWHCDNYGIDTITTATIMAFLMECFQRGYLTKEDADGLELTWGNEADALDLHPPPGPRRDGAGPGPPARGWWTWSIGSPNAIAREPEPTCDPSWNSSPCRPRGCPSPSTGPIVRSPCRAPMPLPATSAHTTPPPGSSRWTSWAHFPTFEDKARALMTYPRVRLGNDNMGVCKLPWVDVFNPESAKVENPDMHINPATQEIYAEFYNGVLGTDLTWQQIFEQTDRDINLQRVMNVMVYGSETGSMDWIPDRAIGATDDLLYENEQEYNDQQLEKILAKTPDRSRAADNGGKAGNPDEFQKRGTATTDCHLLPEAWLE